MHKRGTTNIPEEHQWWGTKKGVEIALFVLVFLEKDG
jgi:hypothetical protein